MLEVKTIRLNNMLALVKPKTRGNIIKFAREYDVSEIFLSAIFAGRRNIGEDAARNFEEKIGLRYGILDVPDMNPSLSYYQMKDIEHVLKGAQFLTDARKKLYIDEMSAAEKQWSAERVGLEDKETSSKP